MITLTFHLNVDSIRELMDDHPEIAELTEYIINSEVCLFWEENEIVEEEER